MLNAECFCFAANKSGVVVRLYNIFTTSGAERSSESTRASTRSRRLIGNDVAERLSIPVERDGAPPEHAGLRPGEPVSAAGAAYVELLRFPA